MTEENNIKIIEGVFTGEAMKGDDKNKYPMPPNYASKSKLVEGDRLKLTISEDGSFIFKQIEPIVRKRVIATVQKEKDNFYIVAGEKRYKILTASATYFALEPGDEVVALIPQNIDASWAALENKIGEN